MTNETFDTTALQERVQKQEEKTDFYVYSLLMLQEEYGIGDYLQMDSDEGIFPDLEDKYLLNALIQGETITRQHILRADTADVDDFLFGCLVMIGLITLTGVLSEQGDEDSIEYRDWIMECQGDDDWFLQMTMLSAYFLTTGSIASETMLSRLAPKTRDKETNQLTCDVTLEFFQQLVLRFTDKKKLQEKKKRLFDESGSNF